MASIEELTAQFEESCALWVSDEDYNNPKNPLYVHQNSRNAAEEILTEWKKPDGNRMVLLGSQMQSGKTSVMRHLAYLLNVKKEHKNLKIDRDSTFILINLSDNALLDQTIDRMAGVMMAPSLNVMHPTKSALTEGPAAAALKKNRVLIIDESHYGTGNGGRIDKILIDYNSPLFNDKKTMVDSNVYVLLVSATPFAELGFNTEEKKPFSLAVDPTYYGLSQMLAKGRVADSAKAAFLKPEATDKDFEAALKMLGSTPGFIFIRENKKNKNCVAWTAKFKAYLDKLPEVDNIAGSTYFSMNGDTVTKNADSLLKLYGNCVGLATYRLCIAIAKKNKLSGIDAILCTPPDRLVFIFVKRMLLAGKSLDTKFVRATIDYPLRSTDSGNVDTLVQGFVGRCCGYGKMDNNVICFTNVSKVVAYVDWMQGETVPLKPSSRSRGKLRPSVSGDDKGVRLATRKTSAYASAKREQHDWESSSGSDGDEDINDKDIKKKQPDAVVAPVAIVEEEEECDVPQKKIDPAKQVKKVSKADKAAKAAKLAAKIHIDPAPAAPVVAHLAAPVVAPLATPAPEKEIINLDGTEIVAGVTLVKDFLQKNGFDPVEVYDEIMNDKGDFFQPRDADYMKYRGNEISRSKAFSVDSLNPVPVYVYPGFTYESVLHYSTFDQYGGKVVEIKNLISKLLKQPINHVIISKYDQPDDGIGFHNDKPNTIADDSIIAVISLGKLRRFQICNTPEDKKSTARDVVAEIVTTEGSLICMTSTANIQFQHGVEKCAVDKGDVIGGRVSIVFRHIKNLVSADVVQKKAARKGEVVEEVKESVEYVSDEDTFLDQVDWSTVFDLYEEYQSDDDYIEDVDVSIFQDKLIHENENTDFY